MSGDLSPSGKLTSLSSRDQGAVLAPSFSRVKMPGNTGTLGSVAVAATWLWCCRCAALVQGLVRGGRLACCALVMVRWLMHWMGQEGSIVLGRLARMVNMPAKGRGRTSLYGSAAPAGVSFVPGGLSVASCMTLGGAGQGLAAGGFPGGGFCMLVGETGSDAGIRDHLCCLANNQP